MNKVSVTKVEDMMKNKSVTEVGVEVNGLAINIKTSLSLDNMKDVVSYLYNSSFSEEGDYLPEAFDFAKRCIAIDVYTNVTMPRNIERKYALAYNSGIFEAICQVVNMDQFNSVCESAYRKIENRLRTNGDAIRNELVKVVDAFKEVAEKLSLFSEITPDDISAAVSSISEHGIDEAKLIEAYMKHKSE